MHYHYDNWSAVNNNGPYSPYRRVTSTVAAQYTALSVTTLHIKLVKNWQQIKNVIASLTSDYNTNSQVYTQIKEKQPAQFHAFLSNSYCTVTKLSKHKLSMHLKYQRSNLLYPAVCWDVREQAEVTPCSRCVPTGPRSHWRQQQVPSEWRLSQDRAVNTVTFHRLRHYWAVWNNNNNSCRFCLSFSLNSHGYQTLTRSTLIYRIVSYRPLYWFRELTPDDLLSFNSIRRLKTNIAVLHIWWLRKLMNDFYCNKLALKQRQPQQ